MLAPLWKPVVLLLKPEWNSPAIKCEKLGKNEEQWQGWGKKWILSSAPLSLPFFAQTTRPFSTFLVHPKHTACSMFLPGKWKGNVSYADFICFSFFRDSYFLLLICQAIVFAPFTLFCTLRWTVSDCLRLIIIIIIIIIIIVIIVSITKFSIVIGYPRPYLSRNRRAITWVSDYRCPIWKSSNRTPVIGYPRDFHVN